MQVIVRGVSYAADVLFAIGLVATLPVAACANAENGSIKICDVVADPVAYDKKTIRLAARIESDGMEHVLLIDAACRDTGIALVVPDSPGQENGVNLLRDAIVSGKQPGTLDKEITAQVTGIFEWRPDEIPARTLTLIRVTNVRVTPK